MTVTQILPSISLAVALLAGTPALSTPAQAPAFAGRWEGQYKTGGGGGNLQMLIERTDGKWSIQVRTESEYSPPNPQFRPASDIEISGSAVKFVMDWGGPVNFNGKIAGDTMSGELVSQYYSGTWSVQRKKAKSPSAALGGR